jgi:hypothetical protein
VVFQRHEEVAPPLISLQLVGKEPGREDMTNRRSDEGRHEEIGGLMRFW